MNQNDQSNVTAENGGIHLEAQLDAKKKSEANKNLRRREWLPEDDDDWYEPDCARRERAS